MKIKTLVAAAAIATASTAAVADVTTADGELVMIEKNQVALSAGLLGQLAPFIIATAVTAIVVGGGTSSN